MMDLQGSDYNLQTGSKPFDKKILFVSHEASISGAPLFLVKLLRYLKVERPEYTIAVFFSKNGELVELLQKEGFDVFVSEKRQDINSILFNVWNRLRHYYRYLQVLFTYRPDLVYSNTIVNFGEVILSGLFNKTVLLHMHEGKNFASACRYRLKISCIFTSRIIVGSHYVNNVLYDLTHRHGVVVYNGVDTSNVIQIKRRHSHDPLKIGILGTIDSNKGQLVAIKAIQRLVEKGLTVKLQIAGKVMDEVYYAQLCDSIKLSSLNEFVEYLGPVSDAEVFLNSLDILVVPSFDESFPTVILEAFSTGTVVVASNVGGIPEMIEHGENGLLFPAGDFVMLAEILNRIFHTSNILEELSKHALKNLHSKFSLNANNQLLTANIDDMLLS
jgi:glycosyltransferase involved in cell wall biosynthesis